MYIEEYDKWIKNNPDKVCNKIKKIYDKLAKDVKTPKKVSFFNASTNETETHTYKFDEKKGKRPIEFIEKFLKQSKGKWNGKPLKLELFQKAMIEAAFMLWLYKKAPQRIGSGYFFGTAILCIFTCRFFIELCKEVQEPWELQMQDMIGINQGQLLSIPFILLGGYLVWRSVKKKA